ncbi:hypothetical protein JP0049_04920 [Helicobacter pylori]|nr:hypothetical protein JP0049_04920 [Helicobacter pylori]
MNATNLETYAALQKPSHVFGNYAAKKTEPDSTNPPHKEEPSSSGNSVASQLVKDAATINNLKSVSVSGMNTTLSGVETMFSQTTTISALLNSSTDLSSVIFKRSRAKQCVWRIRKRSKHFKRLFGFF